MQTEALHQSMAAWRRDFHGHPELGFEEVRTAARVAGLLGAFGFDVHTGIGTTGVVGVLQRGNGTRAIDLRADMDALPIPEQNTFAHRSLHDGAMHACGHDGHTAMLLGAAQYLARDGDFSGRLVVIFQPAEEHGKGGPAMIADGLFDRFPVDAVYGIHNMPVLAIGSFAVREGAIMSSEALFTIEVQGRGGHAAMPHRGVDALVVGAEIVTALQTIVSRNLDPGLNGVVSVTDLRTDGQRHVLPGRVTLTGDACALNRESNAQIEARMRQIVEGVCMAHGAIGTVTYETIFDVTVNAPAPTASAVRAARVVSDHADSACPPVLGSEDFARMALVRPGCFLFGGNGTSGAAAEPLHSARYDFNDDLLVPGSSFWVQLVEQELQDRAA